jgi:Zn ribbon nucleic-acid-binding protein
MPPTVSSVGSLALDIALSFSEGLPVAQIHPIAKERFASTARCEKCGGYAFLGRSAYDAFRRDGSEVRTYECVDCEHKMQRFGPPLKYRG